MQYVSAAYKAGMKQLARNKSFMKISIGLINQKAQQNAQVQNSGFTYFSDLTKPLNNESVAKVYATYEENYAAVNESMYFLPREGSTSTFYNAGMTTEELCSEGSPEITIIFNTTDPVDLKGLTINFGKSYPTSFRVSTETKTIDFTNSSSIFKTEEVFENITYMKFTPLVMKKGKARFRICTLTFGIGIVFDNEKIVKADLKSTISPIGENLPTIDFDVTIENIDKYYNVDNEDSAINFMETGQEIEVFFGYTLNDGTVEWFKGATLSMQEWSADDTQAKFGAVDKFEYMQDEYKKGEYRPEGITLYNLAVDVFEDAGMDADAYWIDPYLKNIIVYNPLPVIMHKECLQLIAGAGRSTIMQSRDGVIMLKSSFVPDITVSANQTAEYADVQEILSGTEYHEYAAYENNYTKTNQTQYFIPRNQSYIKTGYVSESISDENGYFTENPIITFDLESAYTFYNITLLFGSIQPVAFTMRTYNNGTRIAAYDSKNITEKTIVNYDFIDIDKIEIEFTKTKPSNRIHLKRVEFGESTDYELTYDELLKPPSGTKLEKVKEIRVIRTIYTKGSDQKDITQEEITLPTVVTDYEFEFGNAVHDLTVICKVGEEEFLCGAQIVESRSYWCKVRINNPPSIATDVVLTIKGYEYGISTATKSAKLNNTGKIQTWDNPLISSDDDANNLVKWVGNYYASGNEYELSFRGDPAIDANDLIYLESRYSDELMVRVEEMETSYSGSLSGKITARREV